MTIKNIRQFNSILSSVGNVEQHYTDLLTFAVDNIHRHGNKDPMLSFLNAPFIRTKAGKVKKHYAPMIQWLNSACPALTIGERSENKITKFSAASLPAKLDGFNILFDKQKEVTILSFTDWLTERSEGKAPATPATARTIGVKAAQNTLNGIIAGNLKVLELKDITDTLELMQLAAQAIARQATSITMVDLDLQRVAELAGTKPTGAETSAPQKQNA